MRACPKEMDIKGFVAVITTQAAFLFAMQTRKRGGKKW